MKRGILLLLFAVSSLAIFAQCLPSPTGLPPGFNPTDDNIPCLVQNQAYNQAFTFQNWDSITVSGIRVKVNYLIFDSIMNLPCGVSWSSNIITNNIITNRLDNQESGCIFFNGTTSDPVGEYKLRIKVRMQITLLPNEVPYDMESLGYKVYLRVKANSGSICPAVDTTASAVLQTSTCDLGFQNTYFNTVRGKVYVDTDGNGSFNGNDYGLAGYRVNTGVANNNAYTNQTGEYLLYLPTGTYNVAPSANTNYALSTAQSQYPFNFSSGGLDYPGNDFGFTVTNSITDLAVTVNNSFFRLGFPAQYVVSVTNLGTVPYSSTVNLDFDTLFTVNGTTPNALTQSAGKASWAVTNLTPGQTQNFTLNITTPVVTSLLGTFVNATAYLDSLAGDVDFTNDTFVNVSEIRGAYDPNDKTAYPSVLSEEFVDGNSYITYRIRFQNTGNDTAFNVTVRDTINSPHLDVNSLQMLSASHEFNLRIEEGNIAIWDFPNILLPDSNVNEPGSHGYIFFRIKINNANMGDGTEILNQVGIYFDFNPVVMTEPSVARVDFGSGIFNAVFSNSQIKLYPNPATNTLTMEYSDWKNESTLQLVDITGKLMLSQPISGKTTQLDINNLPNGMYLYRVLSVNGIEGIGKVVIAR
jgi:uncharacterized repeat protein (TIGR01451 family)